MPTQSSDIDAATNDAIDFMSEGEIYIIKGGVSVLSEQAIGVESDFSSIVLQNHGYIAGTGDAIHLDADNCQVDNYSDGTIYGTPDAIAVFGDSDKIDNQGSISGNTWGIYIESNNAKINNSGYVYGNSIGIYASGTGNNIFNSGTIIADEGISFVLSEKQSATANNTGLIRGGSGTAIISSKTGSLKLTNSGTLDGNVSLANTGGDTIRNKGEIDGNVQLGGGKNTFDGRGGSIDSGVLFGGAGVDTVYLGNDGETVSAGVGHDTIYGGSGADIFAYGSYAAANSDTIFGFNVSNDRVQLNHTVFSKLTAGATPAFSVASAATSAADYLFYNSASGGLYYDPDGSGSGAADLIAKLDPSLKMTAHDFKVL